MVGCMNVNSQVRWSNLVYKVGMATDLATKARGECLKQAGKDVLVDLNYDRPCPCSFWQAIFDSRYRYVSYYLARITGDTSFYNSLCYVQRFRPRSPLGVQLCCYSFDFK